MGRGPGAPGTRRGHSKMFSGPQHHKTAEQAYLAARTEQLLIMWEEWVTWNMPSGVEGTRP